MLLPVHNSAPTVNNYVLAIYVQVPFTTTLDQLQSVQYQQGCRLTCMGDVPEVKLGQQSRYFMGVNLRPLNIEDSFTFLDIGIVGYTASFWTFAK